MALAFITTAKNEKAAKKTARFLESYGIPVVINRNADKRYALLTDRMHAHRARSIRSAR
ncbi:hypothetical protein LLE49_25105 [Alicyclobacillus tolerans]|uniref:hypothetical protein n=1 Tax=Alicyclobacillus tolerans TaxID=90970 RepID=UPI001F370981|nr:hypothetical protein [Alicyclobacillus tolerans]MCF8568007.1 hypothetical protein [Alicyclobacillus tolerans]